MEYVNLGGTGLRVSRVCLGMMSFGNDSDRPWVLDEDTAEPIVRAAVDGGITFAEEIGLEPVVIAGQGEAGMPTIRNPLRFSATPPRYTLPPPGLDEHGAEIRRWLAEETAT